MNGESRGRGRANYLEVGDFSGGVRAMAEPVRKRGRRSRGGGVGRGTRGARGRRPGAQQCPARRSVESVLVDLVSDSDEEILEVSTACGSADPLGVPLPESAVPVAPPDHRDDSDSDSEGADARPAGAPPTLVRRRRRLLLDPGEAAAVPVYSEKVSPFRGMAGWGAGAGGLGWSAEGRFGGRSWGPGPSRALRAERCRVPGVSAYWDVKEGV